MFVFYVHFFVLFSFITYKKLRNWIIREYYLWRFCVLEVGKTYILSRTIPEGFIFGEGGKIYSFLSLKPVAIGYMCMSVCLCVCVYWNPICFFVDDCQIQKHERSITFSIIYDLCFNSLTAELFPIAPSPNMPVLPTILFLKTVHAY